MWIKKDQLNILWLFTENPDLSNLNNLQKLKIDSSLFSELTPESDAIEVILIEKNNNIVLPDCNKCGDYERCAFHYDECTGFIPC